MTEDSNNAVSNSFLLDDDSRLVHYMPYLMELWYLLRNEDLPGDGESANLTM